MRKSLLILLLLLSSSSIICQVTNTNLTKCFDAAQIDELYKGIQQSEYLKLRLGKTESALGNADAVISSQSKLIDKMSQESDAKAKLIGDLQSLNISEKDLCDITINRLTSEIIYIKTNNKESQKKAFWRGVKIGGVAVGVVGTALLLLAK